MKLLRKVWLLLFVQIIVFVSCNKTVQEYKFYTIKKRDYQNTIKVSGFLKAENSTTISCPRLRSDLTITYLVNNGTIVKSGDTVCILAAPAVAINYENSLKDLEISKAEYNKSLEELNLQILLLSSQVKTIEATSKITGLDSLQKKFSSETAKRIIDLEIKKTELEKLKIKNKLKFLKEIHQSELEKLKLKIQQSENNVNRSKEILDKLVITTKSAGITIRSKSWSTGEKVKEGDIIWGGQPIVLIPDLSKMQANLVLTESDIKRVSENQNLQMKVDAFPEMLLKGKVIKKISRGRPIQKNSPIKVYDVIANIDSSTAQLKPGLNITASIFIEELSDTIAVPVTCVFDIDSNKVVYIKNNDKYREQIVEVATQSITQAVISSGLKEQDIITTFKPPSNKIQ